MDELVAMMRLQGGVVTRAQALAAGLADHDVRRLLRRRTWAVVHPGVYVDHTGPLTWQQRTWAAVLAMEPAALAHRTALAVDAGREHEGPIHVMVDRDRMVSAPPGVVRHRVAAFEAKRRANTSPPRQRTEEALVDVAASARDELEAIGVLCDAVAGRRTTAARVRAALDGRSRIARRRLLAGVLDDLDAGACSVLEQGYLTRVERPHGLPVADRQVRASGRGTVFRDVEYRPWKQVVELDGRAFHSLTRDRARDLDRDLAAAVAGKDTVRLGWGQVFATACETAAAVGALLQARGWEGRPTMCPTCPTCPPDSVAELSPGDS